MSIQEHYVSSARTVANAGWTLTAILLIAAWSVILGDEDDWLIGGMLAATSVLTAIIAATMQVRIYVVKVCNLIRAGGGDSGDSHDRVSAIR